MKELLIGLMSGTSMDSTDGALVRFADNLPQLLATYTVPIPPTIREALSCFAQPQHDELNRLAQLDSEMARLFAKTVHGLLSKANIRPERIRAIGNHGQTVRHAPNIREPYTIQIGNPSLLVELTGITTVADFRRRDMAAGGQGAPLAPAFHKAFFRHPSETRVVVNIGGMANITILPPKHAGQPVSGFDTGPGNVLLDAWAQQHLHLPLDRDGRWGSEGRTIPELLQCCLQDPYFTLPPPKSTGREYFDLHWLSEKLIGLDRPAPSQDIQASLIELTARSIVLAIQDHGRQPKRVLVCGGGVHNPALMRALQHCLGDIPLETTATHGLNPDYLEAVGFAWLAKRTLDGLAGNLPEVTGAKGRRILGGVYFA